MKLLILLKLVIAIPLDRISTSKYKQDKTAISFLLSGFIMRNGGPNRETSNTRGSRVSLLVCRSNVLSQTSKFRDSLFPCAGVLVRQEMAGSEVHETWAFSTFESFYNPFDLSSGNDYTGQDYCELCLQLLRHLQWFEGSSELIKGSNSLSLSSFLPRLSPRKDL